MTLRFVTIPPAPPQLETIIHHFDFSDTTTLWRDEAGTLDVAASGDFILRIDNKGFDGTNLTNSASANAPIWSAGTGGEAINGRGVGNFASNAAAGRWLEATIADAAGAELGNYTVAVVVVHDVNNPGTIDMAFGWGSAFGEMNIQNTFNQTQAQINNTAVYNAISDPSTGTEYAVILDNDGAANQEVRFSSDVAHLTRAEASGGPADGTDFAIGDSAGSGHPAFPWNGRIAEILVWTPALSSGDRDAAEAYVTEKWGITWA